MMTDEEMKIVAMKKQLKELEKKNAPGKHDQVEHGSWAAQNGNTVDNDGSTAAAHTGLIGNIENRIQGIMHPKPILWGNKDTAKVADYYTNPANTDAHARFKDVIKQVQDEKLTVEEGAETLKTMLLTTDGDVLRHNGFLGTENVDKADLMSLVQDAAYIDKVKMMKGILYAKNAPGRHDQLEHGNWAQEHDSPGGDKVNTDGNFDGQVTDPKATSAAATEPKTVAYRIKLGNYNVMRAGLGTTKNVPTQEYYDSAKTKLNDITNTLLDMSKQARANGDDNMSFAVHRALDELDKQSDWMEKGDTYNHLKDPSAIKDATVDDIINHEYNFNTAKDDLEKRFVDKDGNVQAIGSTLHDSNRRFEDAMKDTIANLNKLKEIEKDRKSGVIKNPEWYYGNKEMALRNILKSLGEADASNQFLNNIASTKPEQVASDYNGQITYQKEPLTDKVSMPNKVPDTKLVTSMKFAAGHGIYRLVELPTLKPQIVEYNNNLKMLKQYYGKQLEDTMVKSATIKATGKNEFMD